MNTPVKEISKPDRPAIAVATVLSASLLFSLGDAIVKLISVDLGLWQILVLRALISIPALIVICRLSSTPVRLAPMALGWTATRSILMISMWVTYYAALLTLPVSVAASVYYTMPIFVSLIAAIFIGDRIGNLGWTGVALGFVGVLLIVKPDKDGFNLFTIFPLMSAIFFAFAMIVTRARLRDEHPYALTINLQLGFLVTGLIATGFVHVMGSIEGTPVATFFGGSWKDVGTREWLVLFVLACIITVGNIGTSLAYQLGRSSMIATFSFSYIPFAIVWGFIFFGEVPDAMTFLGIFLIISAGILAIRN